MTLLIFTSWFSVVSRNTNVNIISNNLIWWFIDSQDWDDNMNKSLIHKFFYILVNWLSFEMRGNPRGKLKGSILIGIEEF